MTSAVENALAAYSGTTAAPHEYFDQTGWDLAYRRPPLLPSALPDDDVSPASFLMPKEIVEDTSTVEGDLASTVTVEGASTVEGGPSATVEADLSSTVEDSR